MAVMLQFPLGDVVVDLYDEGEPSRICESFTRLCARSTTTAVSCTRCKAAAWRRRATRVARARGLLRVPSRRRRAKIHKTYTNRR